jgi:hypothetical protein
MTILSPAAQAVAWAYDNTPESPTGNHRYHWLAAALRAAAIHLYCEEYETCGGASYALMIEQEDLLALAAELEGWSWAGLHEAQPLPPAP